MASAETSFKDMKRNLERDYIVNCSSETLFAPSGNSAVSSKMTPIAVRHYQSGQTLSFATHAAAETIGIAQENVEARFDEVEREILTQFYRLSVRTKRACATRGRAPTMGCFEHG